MKNNNNDSDKDNNIHAAFLLESSTGSLEGPTFMLRFWQGSQNGLALYGNPVVMDGGTLKELGRRLNDHDEALNAVFRIQNLTDDENNRGKMISFPLSNVTAFIGDLAVKELVKRIKELT